jgi:hypothetical protein
MKNVLLLSVSFLLLVSSCTKEATSWDATFQAPFVHDTLSLDAWVNDSTLAINGSNLEIDLERTLLDLGLSELIKLPDTTVSQTYHPVLSLSNVSPGTTFVNNVEPHQLELQDIELKKIHVSEGKIKVKVTNPLATSVIFTVKLPGVTQNNVVFTQSYAVGALSTQEEWLDLSNYTIDLRGAQGLEYNVLQSQLAIQTDPTGPSVSISTSNTFVFQATFSQLKLDYALGYFGNQTLYDQANFSVGFLSKINSGQLDLSNVNLQLSLENGFKVPVRGRIDYLKNTNNQLQTVSLTAPEIGPSFYISPATGSWNTLQANSHVLNFTSATSNIEAYLENLGAQQQLSYELQLNPWGNISQGNDEAFPNSRIRIKAAAQLPMQLTADALTLRDTFAIDLHQSSSKTHVVNADVIVEALNAFPLSCQVNLHFISNGQVLESVVASSPISSSEMGTLDPVDGLKKKKSTLVFELPESLVSQLDQLDQVVVEAIFDTPDPATGISSAKSIPAHAFLAVKLRLKAKTQLVL